MTTANACVETARKMLPKHRPNRYLVTYNLSLGHAMHSSSIDCATLIDCRCLISILVCPATKRVCLRTNWWHRFCGSRVSAASAYAIMHIMYFRSLIVTNFIAISTLRMDELWKFMEILFHSFYFLFRFGRYLLQSLFFCYFFFFSLLSYYINGVACPNSKLLLFLCRSFNHEANSTSRRNWKEFTSHYVYGPC